MVAACFNEASNAGGRPAASTVIVERRQAWIVRGTCTVILVDIAGRSFSTPAPTCT